MTEHLQGYPYSQDVITRLHARAEGYRQSGPSAVHTADLLDEAAGCIAALLADLHAYRLTCERIAKEPALHEFSMGHLGQTDLREAIARMIDPPSWRVFDHELERVKRHHPNGGYDPDNFKDRASLALADRILALAQGVRRD